MATKVSGDMRIRPSAIAVRAVAALSVTSTMRGLPSGPMCVKPSPSESESGFANEFLPYAGQESGND
jgi:hypothetical protein